MCRRSAFFSLTADFGSFEFRKINISAAQYAFERMCCAHNAEQSMKLCWWSGWCVGGLAAVIVMH